MEAHFREVALCASLKGVATSEELLVHIVKGSVQRKIRHQQIGECRTYHTIPYHVYGDGALLFTGVRLGYLLALTNLEFLEFLLKFEKCVHPKVTNLQRFPLIYQSIASAPM